MKLNKAAKLRLFGRITKWSSDKIRFNRKAINDLIGDCDGGSSSSADINDIHDLISRLCKYCKQDRYYEHGILDIIVDKDIDALDYLNNLSIVTSDIINVDESSLKFVVTEFVSESSYEFNIDFKHNNDTGLLECTMVTIYTQPGDSSEEYNNKFTFNPDTKEISENINVINA